MTQASKQQLESLIVKGQSEAKFERGFKSWTENTAVTLRGALNLGHVAPLPPRSLAEHLGAVVWEPNDVPDLEPESLAHLTSSKGDEWSAVTVRCGTTDVIVLNPLHAPPRQSSDLMHELAHLLRRHEPAQIVISAETGVGLRAFNPLQEAEANWLAATLLLPREALVWCSYRGLTRPEIAERYTVSEELVRYRMNMTGVSRMPHA